MYIPIRTLWKRSEGWVIPEGELKPADLRWTFAGALGIPFPNPLYPKTRRVYNKTLTYEGFSIEIQEAVWNNGELQLYMSVLSVPPGGMTTAWPIAGILAAIAILTGLGLLIILLSKIEAVFKLPLAWIIVGGAGVLALPVMIKNIKGVAV